MERVSIGGAGRTLAAGSLETALILAVVPAAARNAEQPTAHAAQYADPPWCQGHVRLTGYGSTKTHRVGSWGPGSGLRFYKIKMRVKVQKCTRWSRILYYLYLDTSDLPSDRHVLLQFQSAGKLHKWKAACTNGRCIYDVKGGQKIPQFGARPVIQFRVTTKGLIRNTRVPNGVVQGEAGWGQWVASPPKTYYAGITYQRGGG
jgi:hypothetical protein